MALRIETLARHHDRAGFSCGVPALDDYLKQRAGQHQRDGIATTHVLVDDAQPGRILGWCSLAAAQLLLEDLQPADRKRLPAYPVPAVRLARLAVQATEHGRGYGGVLLGHAVNASLGLRATLGVRVLIVDAKDDAATRFYQAHGFRPTATQALTCYLALCAR